MPLPEGYLPREGDVLVLHAIVKHNVDPGEDLVFVRLKGHYGTETSRLSEVVALFSRHWDVGDGVRNVYDHEDVGEVMAVHEDSVWVKLGSGSLATFAANDLEEWPTNPVAAAIAEGRAPTLDEVAAVAAPPDGSHLVEPVPPSEPLIDLTKPEEETPL